MELRNVIKDPIKYLYFITARFIGDDVNKEIKYLKRRYKHQFNEKLDFDNPKNFNEKIQWLKINDRNPIYTQLVDKYEFKRYINELLGKGFTFDTLGIWDKFEDIDFDKLPDRFVLKCTHDSGGIYICKDKSVFDRAVAKKKIESSLKKNYFINSREWPYKNVKPRIIAEKFVEDVEGEDLKDYKVYVFNGKVKCVHVDYDRFTNHRRNFYDCDWNYLPFTTLYPTDSQYIIEKPEKLEEMILFSETITESIGTPDFLRVDFYIVKGNIYVGEVTFYHGSGFEKFYPAEWNYILGDWLNLHKKEMTQEDE